MQALQVAHLNIWQEGGKIIMVAQPMSEQELEVVKGYKLVDWPKGLVLVGDLRMCPWNLPPKTYQGPHSK